jgi:hypothetical protein
MQSPQNSSRQTVVDTFDMQNLLHFGKGPIAIQQMLGQILQQESQKAQAVSGPEMPGRRMSVMERLGQYRCPLAGEARPNGLRAPALIATGSDWDCRPCVEPGDFMALFNQGGISAVAEYVQQCIQTRAYWLICYASPPDRASLEARRLDSNATREQRREAWKELCFEELSVLTPYFVGVEVIINHTGNDPELDPPLPQGCVRKTLGLITQSRQDPQTGTVYVLVKPYDGIEGFVLCALLEFNIMRGVSIQHVRARHCAQIREVSVCLQGKRSGTWLHSIVLDSSKLDQCARAYTTPSFFVSRCSSGSASLKDAADDRDIDSDSELEMTSCSGVRPRVGSSGHLVEKSDDAGSVSFGSTAKLCSKVVFLPRWAQFRHCPEVGTTRKQHSLRHTRLSSRATGVNAAVLAKAVAVFRDAADATRGLQLSRNKNTALFMPDLGSSCESLLPRFKSVDADSHHLNPPNYFTRSSTSTLHPSARRSLLSQTQPVFQLDRVSNSNPSVMNSFQTQGSFRGGSSQGPTDHLVSAASVAASSLEQQSAATNGSLAASNSISQLSGIASAASSLGSTAAPHIGGMPGDAGIVLQPLPSTGPSGVVSPDTTTLVNQESTDAGGASGTATVDDWQTNTQVTHGGVREGTAVKDLSGDDILDQFASKTDAGMRQLQELFTDAFQKNPSADAQQIMGKTLPVLQQLMSDLPGMLQHSRKWLEGHQILESTAAEARRSEVSRTAQVVKTMFDTCAQFAESDDEVAGVLRGSDSVQQQLVNEESVRLSPDNILALQTVLSRASAHAEIYALTRAKRAPFGGGSIEARASAVSSESNVAQQEQARSQTTPQSPYESMHAHHAPADGLLEPGPSRQAQIEPTSVPDYLRSAWTDFNHLVNDGHALSSHLERSRESPLSTTSAYGRPAQFSHNPASGVFRAGADRPVVSLEQMTSAAAAAQLKDTRGQAVESKLYTLQAKLDAAIRELESRNGHVSSSASVFNNRSSSSHKTLGETQSSSSQIMHDYTRGGVYPTKPGNGVALLMEQFQSNGPLGTTFVGEVSRSSAHDPSGQMSKKRSFGSLSEPSREMATKKRVAQSFRPSSPGFAVEGTRGGVDVHSEFQKACAAAGQGSTAARYDNMFK